MSQPQRFSSAETAGIYERLLMPRVFIPWGMLLLGKAGIQAGSAVLDVATGPGTLARLAAEQAGPSGRVAGLDNSAAMLGQAKAKPPVPGSAPVEYFEAPADKLPFADASFDIVLCQQGLQFFPDQLAALKEMRRALKPGGRAALALWAGPKAMALMATFHEAMAVVAPQAPQMAAYGWLSAEQVTSLLSQAGFGAIQAAVETLAIPFELGIPQALECAYGTSLGEQLRALPEADRRRFEELAGRALAAWEKGGQLSVPTQALVAVAVVEG